MNGIPSTSGRLLSEVFRLLFLQTHRETDLFFTGSGVQFVHSTSGLFYFRHTVVSSPLLSLMWGENRPASRGTGLEMPCCPASDLLWVQITQSYPNRLKFSSSPCPQSPCHTVIDPVFKEGLFPR
jgi:hypothetical protein